MRAPDLVRADLACRLRKRRSEISQAILECVRDGLSDPVGEGNAEYTAGLAQTVGAVLDFGLKGIERGAERSGPIPSVALEQVRRAVRAGVSLETVMRRYVAGYTLLWDFVVEEAECGGLLKGEALCSLNQTQALLLDRLITSILAEYENELKEAECSPEREQAEGVRQLLAGRRVDAVNLDYDLEGWHLGAIARGAGALTAMRRLASSLDRKLLSVTDGDGTVWAWLGGQPKLAASDIERALSVGWPTGVSLALGESARGIEGWRLTHRQAQAALRVALRKPQWLTRYSDVALLASLLQDEALARSLVEIYLSPLEGQRELHDALRAYLAAGGNAATAAARLGVARKTMERRLRTIEDRLGPLVSAYAELAVALRLHDLDVAPRRAPAVS